MDEKLDSVQLEYTYLLTSQLESQRKYYEEKMARIQDESVLQVRFQFLRIIYKAYSPSERITNYANPVIVC